MTISTSNWVSARSGAEQQPANQGAGTGRGRCSVAGQRLAPETHRTHGQGAHHQREAVAAQTAVVQRSIEPAAKLEQQRYQALGQGFAAQTQGNTIMGGEYPPAAGVESDATAQRHQTHDEGRREAVPDTEAEIGQRLLQDSRGRHFKQGAHGEVRQGADGHAQYHQHLDRNLHPARRLVWRAGQIPGLAVEKDVMNETQRIGDCEHPGEGGRPGKQPVPLRLAEPPETERLAEEHLLG